MIPGPRPPKGHDRPTAGRDRSRALRPARPYPFGEISAPVPGDVPPCVDGPPLVALTRSAKGWAVVSPAGLDEVGDLIEGLSLADLVAEEFGVLPEPDRSARRSARGPAEPPAELPLVDARVAALERTVAQLEHALAARVATERAIGVLAERQQTSPRSAFEELRHDARSQGRPVAELAREVLDSLAADQPAAAAPAAVPPAPREPLPQPRPVSAGADGGS